MEQHYADIILPLAVKGRFTYSIPQGLDGLIVPGTLVLVPFSSKKLYAGTVVAIHDNKPDYENIREVKELLTNIPPLDVRQLQLWSWMSRYYMCSEGEVMKSAIPTAFMPDSDKSGDYAERYKPKTEQYLRLASRFNDDELNGIFEKLKRSARQKDLLLEYLHLSEYTDGIENKPVAKSLLLNNTGCDTTLLNSMVKKHIFEYYSVEVSRLQEVEVETLQSSRLSKAQQSSLDSIKEFFTERDVVLLHGVTSSGKTEVYIHLIDEQLKQGKQVLYMLPEIALTTQIINRLKKYFGSKVGVYHSRFSDAERVEIWKNVAESEPDSGYRLILGVRSSLFLPFKDLGLIIVDEEHDSSYKQQNPSPRYNARDMAVVLAGLYGAKVLLGSASPSIESYGNALSGRYGIVELTERYGAIKLPEIVLADTREAYRKKLMVSLFSPELIEAIDGALAKKEQVVLFQNRRGFAPYLECPECGWIPRCDDCSVSLTYHKGINKLVCHYCGKNVDIPSKCPSCGCSGLKMRGFGTERVEDEIKILFPNAVVGRMDQDTTRGKNGFNKIISDFESGKIDILTGTQMISKGLDFENLTVVGILNADNLLNFPDFRAYERSYQMIEQVSGRAGRRQKQGVVVIQTSDTNNKIIKLLLKHDYANLFKTQCEERQVFNYPPYCRMIIISLKHNDRCELNNYANILASDLRKYLGDKVLGPEFPVVSRIQLWYVKIIVVKLDPTRNLNKNKMMIAESIEQLCKLQGASRLRVVVDVDPY